MTPKQRIRIEKNPGKWIPGYDMVKNFLRSLDEEGYFLIVDGDLDLYWTVPSAYLYLDKKGNVSGQALGKYMILNSDDEIKRFIIKYSNLAAFK